MDQEKIKNFIITQRQNGIPDAEIASFLARKGVDVNNPPKRKETFMEKVANFTGGKEIGEGLGQAIANSDVRSPGSELPNPFTGKVSEPIAKGIATQLDEVQDNAMDIQGNLISRIKEKKARGEDTLKLENALKELGGNIEKIGDTTGELLNQKKLTGKEVIGDALQLGTTIVGAGTLPGVAKTATGATSIGKGIVQGAKAGAISGGAFGASTGVSQGLQDNKSAGEIATKGLLTGIGGAVTGGILGGVIGGVSGGLKGRALRKQVLDGQIQLGEKTATTLTPLQEKANKIARQQGFDDTDIQFINSMKSQDKVKAQKMIEFAEKASKDKRFLERPIDVVGDSMLDRVKFIKTENSKAGKAVNTVAKSLRGQIVDATPIQNKAQNLLDDLGITVGKNGKFNFNKSVFKNTPDLQSKIEKFITEIPQGKTDAYDVHIFKKSIDELVNYGVQGEGLKGNASQILKALRTQADDILDNTFEAYNKANTDYKATRDVLEIVEDLFGKKTGLSKERGGQLLRSVFSNNTQRPRVLALVEQLDKTAKAYGGKFDDNLLDQALFTEILEDIYGTQATTSLQGQVTRAIKGTQKVLEGVRNPIKGAGELLATGIEKTIGVSDETKRKILSALIR